MFSNQLFANYRQKLDNLNVGLVSLCFVVASASASHAQILFRDDFNGNTLNNNYWAIGDWTFDNNRAWFGNTATVANGMATLTLDTYNPDRYGYFRGTEIYSLQDFAMTATGIEFEARVRTNMTARGGVTAFFTYAQVPPDNYAHEIDFEFLTNQIPSQKVLVTSWKDWGASGSTYNDGIHHKSNDNTNGAGQSVTGLDLTRFNTFKIRWLPNSTEWYVNGNLLNSWQEARPTAPMPVRFNFWAPGALWPAAYDANLQPADLASLNQTFTYDIDYVQVSVVPTSVPEPTRDTSPIVVAILGLARWLRGIWCRSA
ncbi:glycoside hydrolase family 16 protein [Pannus brasiliensis CCIBt3594]|uniref:Glycoside hydrolase family 16 protein n=1 Tax=Pannus brasiliensis CCIBt3594 TaxID=1427578 RepID=A0AAW9QQT6_9CHRO